MVMQSAGRGPQSLARWIQDVLCCWTCTVCGFAGRRVRRDKRLVVASTVVCRVCHRPAFGRQTCSPVPRKTPSASRRPTTTGPRVRGEGRSRRARGGRGAGAGRARGGRGAEEGRGKGRGVV